MLSPYDWQEGIGHRAQYVESRLAGGSPVVAASFEEGILLVTYRKQARKLFEVYDELAMGAIGQQSDVEALRQAAVDFAHQEGYNRSEKDVTLHRVMNALSSPIKKAFADFSMVPMVARGLFAQIGSSPSQDVFAFLDYDGDFHVRHRSGYVAPSFESAEILERRLGELNAEKLSGKKAVNALVEIWKAGCGAEDTTEECKENEGLFLEVGTLLRKPEGELRFRYETEYEE